MRSNLAIMAGRAAPCPEQKCLKARVACRFAGYQLPAAGLLPATALISRAKATLMTNSETKTRPPTKDELCAYAEWLFMEYRILCYELWPEPADREMAEASFNARAPMPLSFPFNPHGTAASDFHIPADDRTWREVPQPSTRCLKVLEAVGVTVER